MEAERDEEVVRRQLSELLSELRVALPGVTVLFAFLLAMPFTTRFGELTGTQNAAYYTGLMAAAIAAVLFIAPSAMHRIEHGDEGERAELVETATRIAIAGSVFLIVSMLATIYLAVDIVYDSTAAVLSAGVLGALALWLWFALPLARTLRRRAGG